MELLKYEELTLDNGLHIILKTTPTATISGGLRIDYGALHERPGEEGLAHYLEHCFVRGGTKKYSPEEVERMIAKFGNFNANTGAERILIPVKLLPEDLECYIDVASDMAFNPRIDETRFNQERQRVLREISDNKCKPGFKDGMDLREAFYRGHPSNYFVLGKEEVIEKAKPDDVRAFHSRGFYANNMKLMLVGALPEDTISLVKRYFSDRTQGPSTRPVFPTLQALEDRVTIHRAAPDLLNNDRPSESTSVVGMYFVVPPVKSEDCGPIHFLSKILGDQLFGRLYKSISEGAGLAYGIGAGYDGAHNAGTFSIEGKLVSSKVDEGMSLIFKELEKVQSSLVTDAELDRVKRSSRFSIAQTIETNGDIVDNIACFIYEGLALEDKLAMIERVTREDILKAAQKYIPRKEDGKYVLLVRDPLKK